MIAYEKQDIFFMQEALTAAKIAFSLGEVPIGAVIVKDNKIISCGYNTREITKNALHHAEIIAIENACTALGSWRLDGCTIYVTLEPCPMCAGAIINSRLDRVVFACFDEKSGSLGSLIDLSKVKFNHTPRLKAGVLEKECSNLLKDFFSSLRAN